ncbi:MAG: MBL fold metallo-hydrolase [Gemmataceae bacterium]|nr:MBL fold metallo-hydrolase [Gemmataceae bacterium]
MGPRECDQIPEIPGDPKEILAVTSGRRTFAFLGTGTSVGVPMIGCSCQVCLSSNPKNQRYRCAALLQTPRGNILIDTPPEIRLQLIREKVQSIEAVLFTHYHADHLHGLDDLRPLQIHGGGPVPLYCNDEVEARIRQAFSYAFPSPEVSPSKRGYLPLLNINHIDTDPFSVLGEEIIPIPLIHGEFKVLGFRLKGLAYCTDVNFIPPSSMELLRGLDILVLDALRERPHPAHFSLKQALEVIAELKPAKAYLTHMSHDIDHEEVQARLPAGVELAYDGLALPF